MVCLVGLFCGLVNAVKSAALMVSVRFCRVGNLKITTMKLHRKYTENIQKKFVLAAMAGLGISSAHAATIVWSNSGGSAWLTGTNWTGGAAPGVSDVAQFGANPTSATGLGISLGGTTNNGTANQAVGAIEISSARTSGAVTIGDSSATSGTLTLNGTTVNSVSNVILRNNSSVDLTLKPIQGSTGSMSIALANATDNVVSIDTSSNIIISSDILGTSKHLMIDGAGTGDLRLSGTNTFTGGITVNSSTRLRIDATASLPTTGDLAVNSGARLRFNISGTYGSVGQKLTFNPNQTANPSLDFNTTNINVVWQGNVILSADTRIETNGATGVLTFSGTVSGAGVLNKQATGTLFLSGSANTFSGGLSIGNGTVQDNNSNSGTLGSGNVTFGTSNTPTLDLNGKSATVGLLSGSGTNGIITNTAASSTSTLTLNGTGSQSYSGVIQDGGSGKTTALILSAGTQTLGGTNTYTGGTTINGGTLKLGAGGNIIPDTGAMLIAGGTFDLNGFSETTGPVTLNSGSITDTNGSHTLTSSSFIIKSGTISTPIGGSAGTVTLTKNTDGSGTGGTVTLGTGNTFGGKTTINAGFIATSGESAFGTNPGSFTADQITLNGGGVKSTGTIDFNSNRGITLGANGGTFDTTGGTITLTNIVTGNGALTKTGAGTLILNNVHTYAGGTNVNAGTVQLGVGNIIPDTSAVTVAGGTLDLQNHNETVGAVTVSSGSIIGNGGTLTAASFSVAATGAITFSNSDAVRIAANGTFTNAGAVTSSGAGSNDGIDVQTSTGVAITNASNWSAGAPTTPGTGNIEGARHGITGGPATNIAFITNVTNNLGGTIKGDDGSGINLDGFGASQTATISNNGTITGYGVTGDGDGIDVDGSVSITNTGIIRSSNAFSSTTPAQSEGVTVGGGTIINSGTIEGLVASGNTNAVGRGITLAGNDILTGPLAGTREAIYGNATITNQSGGLIRGDSDSGIVVDGPASGFTVTINNNAGATIRGGGVTNAAIRTGADNDTITTAGTIDGSSSGKAIDMGAGNNTLSITGGSISGSINGGSGGTNALTINPGTGNAFNYSGAISNFSTVTVQSGTVTLGGTNSYAGATTVSGGTLLVSGSISGSAVTVQNGGTLGTSSDLTGGTTGSVTVESGGTLSPGASTGLMTVAGNLTIAGGGIFAVEINATGAAGTNYDQVAVAVPNGDGAVNIGGSSLSLSGSFNTNGVTTNDLFFILLNDGSDVISTTFNGFGEGSHVYAANGQDFIISYQADLTNTTSGNFGTLQGNDIALMAVPEPGTAAMLLGGLSVLLSKRRRRL